MNMHVTVARVQHFYWRLKDAMWMSQFAGRFRSGYARHRVRCRRGCAGRGASGADAVVVNAVAPNVHVLDFYHVG